MSGKLKIVRVLSNPAGKRKAIKCKTKRRPRARVMRKNARPRSTAARSLSGKWIVRIVTPAGKAGYWTGSHWSPVRAVARPFNHRKQAENAFKASKIKRNAWIVADIMPA
jgi:hypothetical protein